MKECPNCKRKYFDDEGNYCFNCRYLLKHIDGTGIDNRTELPINDTIENRNEAIKREAIKRERTLIECPYCHSKDTKKIGAVSRSMSFGMFGFGSSKIGKQWHCNNCKSDF